MSVDVERQCGAISEASTTAHRTRAVIAAAVGATAGVVLATATANQCTAAAGGSAASAPGLNIYCIIIHLKQTKPTGQL